MSTFAEDYCFLREQGMSNRAIAERFGIQWPSLRRQAARHDCWIPDAVERQARLRLKQMRDAGKAFALEALGPSDPVVHGLVAREILAGHLERIARNRYRGVVAA